MSASGTSATKGWHVVEGADEYLALSLTYNGRAQALTPGSVFTFGLSPEAAALMGAQLLAAASHAKTTL